MQGNLGQLYERWDGKGLPKGLSGHNVRLPVCIVTLAQDAIALTEAHDLDQMYELAASACTCQRCAAALLRSGARSGRRNMVGTT